MSLEWNPPCPLSLWFHGSPGVPWVFGVPEVPGSVFGIPDISGVPGPGSLCSVLCTPKVPRLPGVPGLGRPLGTMESLEPEEEVGGKGQRTVRGLRGQSRDMAQFNSSFPEPLSLCGKFISE